ncbi:hypothetical protein HJC23_003800 [Cyclotella cryptica]|uniref:Disease resistance R13L4/SHOC-2-like LRR domain-containing protein n=1 Tax=Cyclotella cryptica TaxID=29204 RepID=A0ABD3Q4V2_9STRA
MSSLDDQIAAKMAAKDKHKSKKSKKKKYPNSIDDDTSDASNKNQPTDSIGGATSERRRGRRMHNLASSGLPKAPPELVYNLDPTAALNSLPSKTETRNKKKNNEDLKSPPEAMMLESTAPGSMASFDPGVSPANGIQFGQSKLSTVSESSATSTSEVQYGRFKSNDSNFAPIPKAKQEQFSDRSPAEELKHASYNRSKSNDSNGASMPGAKQERSSDVSQAERLKNDSYNRSKSYDSSVAKMPGAEEEQFSDMSQAERLKHGGYGKLKRTDVSVTSMPGAKQEQFSDLAQAERLKHGSYGQSKTNDSNVASMPGAKHEHRADMSQAERLKHGNSNRSNISDSNAASMPGVKQEQSSDLSNANRLKHGYYKSDESHSTVALMPGAKEERPQDVSRAERFKFRGNNDDVEASHRSIPGVLAVGAHEVNAATRLKFSNAPQGTTIPGATEGSAANTTEAERLKFGLVNQSARGITGDDESDSYSEEGEGVEMSNYNNDTDNYENHDMNLRRRTMLERKKSLAEEDMDLDDGIEIRQDSYLNLDMNRDSPDEKREVDGWRTCCFICTFISLVIIVALSAALGAANKRASASASTPTAADPTAPAEIVAETTSPTMSPSFAPTTAPKDYSFCYEGNEMAVLNMERYASIRTELVTSGVSTPLDFADDLSYQRKSLCWLAFGDRLSLNAADPFLEQRYVLATIYFALNESQKLLDEGWLSGKTECEWTPMVECDSRSDSIVTRLDLRGSELSGELPRELSFLRDVTYLDVSTNNLEGNVLDAIGNWTHLTTLRMGSNRFTEIPQNLSMLSSLNYFDVSNNEIAGPIPETLASATSLVHLDISSNSFNDTIPTIFGELKSLEALFMHINDLSGSVPEEICSLREVALDRLTVDCAPPGPEVNCDKNCCTACNYYDTDTNPFT